MKNILIILFINIFFAMTGFAFSSVQIPETTMKIARDTGYTEIIPSFQNSPIIRVGIGSNNFGTYAHSSIGVYGTSDIQIYDNKRLIETLPANTNVNVKIDIITEQSSPVFELKLDDGTILGTIRGNVRFTCNDGLLGIKDLKRAGKPALYHGAFEIVRCNKNQFNLVNLVELEEYLKGVVPNEMPVAFGLNALKAQTVAARNYALSPRVKSSPNYDLVDSVASQVYFGANTEKPLATQAVIETEGVVALYGWDLILAQYSSTAGGYTENFSLVFSEPYTKVFPSKERPYLVAKPDILTQTTLNNEEDAAKFYKSRPDSYDIRSPYYRWEKEWTADELHAALLETLPAQSAAGFVKPAFNKGDTLDDLMELKVKRRGESGKIVEMDIVTKSKTYTVQKELMIRRLFVNKGKALPSANVVFEYAQDDYGNITSLKAYGGGYGHGVGLSQFGAGFMGNELHIPYEKILQHYYTGIVLGTKPITLTNTNTSFSQNFYTTNKETNIVVDNHSQVSKLNVTINGKDLMLDISPPHFGDKTIKIDISKYINKGSNSIVFNTDQNGLTGKDKYIKLYVELVKKDDSRTN